GTPSAGAVATPPRAMARAERRLRRCGWSGAWIGARRMAPLMAEPIGESADPERGRPFPDRGGFKTKRLSTVLLFCWGVVTLGLAANAQTWQDPYYTPQNDPYYRNRDGYPDDRYSQQRAYGYGRNAQFLIDRVMADLNRAAERARLDGHERKHFDEVAGNLQ